MSPHHDSGHGHEDHHTDVDWEDMAVQLESSGGAPGPGLLMCYSIPQHRKAS